MKRVLFSVMLLLSVGFTFAQQKSVKEAKSIANASSKPDFAKAQQLINEALTNAETKNDAETWDVAGFVQKRIHEENVKLAVIHQMYDTIADYRSVLNMFQYYAKCDELAQQPNEKGKVKNKFRKDNAETMKTERPNLINGGIYYFNQNNSEEALKYFGEYVASASYQMLEKEDYAKNDTLLPLVSYYATLAASKCKNYDAAIKYSSAAFRDKENGSNAMQLYAEALKAKGDTAKWIESLQNGMLQFPTNQYFFANLIDYYSNHNQLNKAMDFADGMLAKEPNNKLYLYVKGYLYQNLKDYDNAITFYKKTVSVDPTYAEAYSNMGLALLMKAQDVEEKAPQKANDPKAIEAQKQVKAFYNEALGYYVKARSLKPDQKDLWAPALYRIYYKLNMSKEFEEMDKIMNHK